jgi:hypothetical protein
MAEISKWPYDDSHSVRIATVIALVYLPANLVMVRPKLICNTCEADVAQAFFSTIFAHFSFPESSISSPGSRGSVKVYGQVWVALVSIVVLIACTGSIFWLWDRQKRRVTAMSS